jgi:hypothetical protein
MGVLHRISPSRQAMTKGHGGRWASCVQRHVVIRINRGHSAMTSATEVHCCPWEMTGGRTRAQLDVLM